MRNTNRRGFLNKLLGAWTVGTMFIPVYAQGVEYGPRMTGEVKNVVESDLGKQRKEDLKKKLFEKNGAEYKPAYNPSRRLTYQQRKQLSLMPVKEREKTLNEFYGTGEFKDISQEKKQGDLEKKASEQNEKIEQSLYGTYGKYRAGYEGYNVMVEVGKGYAEMIIYERGTGKGKLIVRDGTKNGKRCGPRDGAYDQINFKDIAANSPLREFANSKTLREIYIETVFGEKNSKGNLAEITKEGNFNF